MAREQTEEMKDLIGQSFAPTMVVGAVIAGLIAALIMKMSEAWSMFTVIKTP